ncbi:MAG: family 78 glycoside hydrolase catalytic domain [Acidobacteria bacterium]|nr:family 78 glycoside hydrolase catalytic domain [Acidobacteriota bacterium]
MRFLIAFSPFCQIAVFLACLSSLHLAFGQAKAERLTCNSLITPLGIDMKPPKLSWQLRDERQGARQTAYEVQVASSPSLLQTGKADIWDSGRIGSGKSVDVAYAGTALAPERRYYWRVLTWDQDGKPYPESDVSWWETGLADPNQWRGDWIGYEEPEHRRMREAHAAWITNPGVDGYKGTGDTHHEFRYRFEVPGNLRRADLFVSGQDTAAAWVNGTQVLQAQPLSPWRQMPWKTYVQRDIATKLRDGRNLLAVEITRFAVHSNGARPNLSRTPMSVTLYVEMADGSFKIFKSGEPGWKTALDSGGEWYAPQFDDNAWTDAVLYQVPENNSETALGNPWPTGPVKTLRHEFQIVKPVIAARLYATALGAYQFHLNGRVVGDQVLAPGWMDFRQHVPYQVYDVTSDVRTGRNAIAALLGPGWYTTPLGWFRQGYNYGNTPPALKAQLRLEYTDGSLEWIVTDDSWKADVSPILSAEIYDGETYDARRLQKDWDMPEFPEDHWRSVDLVEPIKPSIVPQYFPPIRVERVLTAKAISSPKPGIYVFDFGQNLAGVPRLRVQGPRGTDIKLRFAEVLNPDGTLYVENLRTAQATDHYILAGNGIEEYQPAFTFHGFRYAEINGLPSAPAADTLKAVVLHTDAPFTSELRTGSSMVNQLWSNILWGQRSNFLGVPTDCPQRDERLGWTADAQVFWRAASYNMNLAAFSRKFAADMRGTQLDTPMFGIFAPGTLTPNAGYAAGWSDAGVIIPWTAWIQYGDLGVVDQNWAAMEKYLGAIESANPDHLWKNHFGIPFGDWLSPEGVTDEGLIATAYWAYDTTLMRQMAHALDRSEDEQKYGRLFEEIKAAFNRAYVSPDGTVKADPSAAGFVPPPGDTGLRLPSETQTGYVLALYMNLLPAELREAAANKLIARIRANDWRLGTGFLGTPYLLGVLTETGHSHVAYRLLLNTRYPSWGYLVEHGATTMWERWNGDKKRNDPSMNSYNHYAYGAVADWVYRYAAGIDADPTDPGFHTVLLHPNFDARLGSLEYSYECPYGTVRSSWTIAGAAAKWNISIPPNAKARISVAPTRVAAFRIDGEPLARSPKVSIAGTQGGMDIYEFPAGRYSLDVALEQP